jgi:hypothetical protein
MYSPVQNPDQSLIDSPIQFSDQNITICPVEMTNQIPIQVPIQIPVQASIQSLIPQPKRKRSSDSETGSSTSTKNTKRIGVTSKAPVTRHDMQPKTTEHILQPTDRYFKILRKFLSLPGSHLWNTPVKFRDMLESDDPANYQVQKKSYENRLPKIARVLMQLIPPIFNGKLQKKHPLLESFSASHRDSITDLTKLISHGEVRWEGVYLLIPWTNMSSTRYSLDTRKPLHQSLNLIEAHRRVLKMEYACGKLVDFLTSTIWNARKHLRRIAPRQLEDAHAVIVWSSNEIQVSISNPEDASKAHTERNAEIAACISNVAPRVLTCESAFAEQCKWLKQNRR